MAVVTFRRPQRRLSLVDAEDGEVHIVSARVPKPQLPPPIIVIHGSDETIHTIAELPEEAVTDSEPTPEPETDPARCTWVSTTDCRLERTVGGVMMSTGSMLIILQLAVTLFGRQHKPLLQDTLHQSFQGFWNGFLLFLAGCTVQLHGWQRTQCSRPSLIPTSLDLTRLERGLRYLRHNRVATFLGDLVIRFHHALHQSSYRIPEMALITCSAALLSGIVALLLAGFAYGRYPTLLSLKSLENLQPLPNVTFPESDSALRLRMKGTHWHRERLTLLGLQLFVVFFTLLGWLVSSVAFTMVLTFWEATPGVKKKVKPVRPKPVMVTVGTDSEGLEDSFEQWMHSMKADETEKVGAGEQLQETLQAIPARIRKISRSISTYLNEAINKEADGSAPGRRVSRVDAGC
ncbi:uncharacterized protein LOC129580997 [Paramacrobiotus metropolitanus]|uniref:uncharacterized protein LOC129580997 n=1 Tax=Paramacrobiotus metropolitanus TaxID=2943436 RepID=UPI002445B342|nr:uncharacterized protein LOC129580997 [Paramacrobiotus metropolitanus]